ncbi:DUF805 domain-containing protein [Isoptericola chiayiensis]|uniref:DUF805 domain-containing protein n=1 Tax=Isoptericola chiayiensis TaxID=579446 RepID=A0ABP8XY64_9MICO|nr:DUF805 domain-containing protein [Isoptericola chiayiensis]NOW02185.1 uncharacterized membrane protein YhaH (DUF805 family) [Isoptericola chiayiensis]
MSFGDAVTSVRTNLTNFSGRARRSEFWWWYLAVVLLGLTVGVVSAIVAAVLVAVDAPVLTTIVGIVLGLALFALWLYVFVGTLAVAVRRLHDTDKSGWFYLLAFVPVANIVLIVFWALEGARGPNQYGADPRLGAVAPAAAPQV